MAIDHTGTVPNQNNRQFFETYINFYLLKYAYRYEGRQPINDRLEACLGKAGCNTNHVLFSNTAIYILIRLDFSERVKECITVIASK